MITERISCRTTDGYQFITQTPIIQTFLFAAVSSQNLAAGAALPPSLAQFGVRVMLSAGIADPGLREAFSAPRSAYPRAALLLDASDTGVPTSGGVMVTTWLEYDGVALAVLAIGLGMVAALAFII